MNPYATFELLYWLRLVALAGLLAWAILHARRRWLRGEPGDQSRAILLPWLVFMLGFAFYLGLLTVLVAPIAVFWVVAVVSIWVAVPSLLSIALLDVGARVMQAERTGFWLGAGIIGYVAVTFLWLALFGIGPLLLISGLWLEWSAIASVPAAGALIWWSWLPGEKGDQISKAFE